MTRGDIQTRLEKMEREKAELRDTISQINTMEAELDPRLTAVKVALRIYGLGGSCPSIQLPVATVEESRGPQSVLSEEQMNALRSEGQ